MKKIVIMIIMLLLLCIPAHASELEAPPAPDAVAPLLPEDRDSFAEGLWYVVRTAFGEVLPELSSALRIGLSVIACCMLVALIENLHGTHRTMITLCGVVAVGCMLFGPVHNLISLASECVRNVSQYGKLLLPVMTAALASQGGTSTATNIYVATAAFDALLCGIISAVLIPCVYLYLLLSVAYAALENDMLDKLRKWLQWFITWGLKIGIYIFMGYISITGVISGTADQTAIKATKLTISGMVPVVGGMLSDASETILLGADVVKNAAGIYGILTLIALTCIPFLKIGVKYLVLKVTGGIYGIFTEKQIKIVLEGFSTSMGFLLAMTGCECLIFLISVVCFMKGMR